MKPFCRRRCVCFRESTGAVQRCYGHPRPRQRTDCCACLQVLSKDEAPVGMFMASTASHGVRCASCNIHYDWTLGEGKVLLRVTGLIGPVERFPAMLCTRFVRSSVCRRMHRDRIFWWTLTLLLLLFYFSTPDRSRGHTSCRATPTSWRATPTYLK